MMWYLICVILLFTISVLTMVIMFMGKKRRILAKRIPGPDGSFLIGLLPLFLSGPEKLLKGLSKLYRTYEQSIFKFWICNNLYIVITRPEDIEFVLNNPKLLLKSKEYKVAEESIMGQGIFSISDIDKWKKNRKTVSGGLRFTVIKSFIPIFYGEAVVLNKVLHTKCDLSSKECEISIPISMATMEMIGRTAFGVKFNAQTDNSHRFVENLHTALSTWEYRIAHPWYLSKAIFRLSSVSKKHNKSQKIINEFSDQLIREKLAEFNRIANDEKKVNIAVTDNEDGCKKPKTVIEILLENHNGMSYEQIRDELVTIMIGGQETTSLANSCAIFMLAHHQDVQQKVFEELQSIFSIGDYEREPTYDDLLQMEYLERVIKETLRLFPPLLVYARKLDEDMQIGKHLCPGGSSLVMIPLFMQTSKHYYTDPLKFNPDNFLPETCHSRHPFTFVPFSAGYRNCIGSKYAMLQMKTVLSTLVRKNRFYASDRYSSPNHLRLMFLATLKFVDKCYVKIQPRTA